MLKSLARFACALGIPLIPFKLLSIQSLIKVILPLVVATTLICSVLLLFALKAPVVQAAPQPSQAVPEQKAVIPPTRPSADATGVLTVAHTASTTHRMVVFGNGRITNNYLNDNGRNQVDQETDDISATTIAILFDQHNPNVPDVGAQNDFAVTEMRLWDPSDISPYSENTETIYTSKVLSYQVTQQTLTKNTGQGDWLVMELVISNTSNITTLTGGKLLYMVDIDVANSQIGDEGGYEQNRRIVYQKDYISPPTNIGFAMGVSLLEGDLRGYDIVGDNYPILDQDLRQVMTSPMRTLSNDENNLVSLIVANLPILPPGQATKVSFGLCAKTGNTAEEAEAKLIQCFSQLADLSIIKKATPSNGSVQVDKPITYTITISNIGSYPISNILVTDIIPVSTSLLTHNISQGTITHNNKVITAEINQLHPSSNPVTITLVVMPEPLVAHGLIISNQAFIKSESLVTKTNVVTHQLLKKPVLHVKKEGPSSAQVNQIITFTFIITNDSLQGNGLPLKITSITDSVASLAASFSGDTNHNDLLEASETWTYTASYIVPISTPHLLTNIVTVVGQDPLSQSTVATASHTTIINHNPILKILLEDGPDNAQVGDTITYTYTVEHASPISDYSPVLVSKVQDSVLGPATLSHKRNNQNDPELLDSSIEEWVYIVTSTVPATAPHQITHTGRVTGIDLDNDIITDDTPIHLTVIQHQPSLSLIKIGPTSAKIGEVAVFTFTVTNAGDGSPITNVSIIDNPIGLITKHQVISGNNNFTLEMSEIWVYTANYTIPAATGDALVNTATVQGKDLDNETHTAVATHSTHLLPQINVVKKGPNTAKVGELITFTVTLTHDLLNGSGAPVTITTVSDSLAGLASYVSGDEDNSGQLEENETWTYLVSYIVPYTSPPYLTNIVTVTGKDILSNTIVATAIHTTQISYSPRINVSKSSPTTTAAVGDKVIYTFEVKHDDNSDGSPIHSIILNDNITGPPIGPVYQQGNTDEYLTKDEIWKYSITYTIQLTDNDPLINTATVTGYDLDSSQTVDHDAHIITSIDHNPVLSLTKKGPATIKIGDIVVYTFTLTNDITQGDGSPIKIVLPIDDDIIGSVTNPSKKNGDFDEWLETGEIWVYTANYTIPTTFPNPLINTAIAQGEDLDNQTLTATATHSAYLLPHINVVKDGPDEAKVGELITFTFTITNDPIKGSGSPVIIDTVEDNIIGSVTEVTGDDNDGLLEEGEIWIYTANHTVSASSPSTLTNVVTVTAENLLSHTIVATSSHTTIVTHQPMLSIDKRGPRTARVGKIVTFTFSINHHSSSDGSPVNNIQVKDSIGGVAKFIKGDKHDDRVLDDGERWEYSITYTIKPTDIVPLENVGTVIGLDFDGDWVVASDTHKIERIINYKPILSIKKDKPTNPKLVEASTFTFTVAHDVKSDGSPVESITVVDSRAGSATYVKGDDGDNKLEKNEEWLFTATHEITLSSLVPLTSTGTVTGYDPEDQVITATTVYSIIIASSKINLPLIFKNYEAPTVCVPYDKSDHHLTHQGTTPESEVTAKFITSSANRYIVEVDAYPNNETYEYGIAFGYRSPEFFRFGIRNSTNRFRLKQHTNTDLTQSRCIKTGGVEDCWESNPQVKPNSNHLKVECTASTIKLYLNNNSNPIQVVPKEKGYDCSGRVGFFIKSTDPDARVDFKDFQLSCPFGRTPNGSQSPPVTITADSD